MTVLKYTDDSLAQVLSNQYTPTEAIKSKNHFRYFKDYLGASGIDAKTIVVEEDYISKDFLHDYASYYAFCFEKYPKFCKRIHFFSVAFEVNTFETQLLDGGVNEIWENYLGFIVVKPIPLTIIGYTVLKMYPNADGFDTRNFWGVRDYSIHLYGKELKVRSLAFQEQDSVLAACATTAIWSMLNKASNDFHTILKSPSEITKDADRVSSDGSRLFPNKGLNLLQICQAIFNSGLVCEVKQPDFLRIVNNEVIGRFVSNSYLRRILNAYSQIGIPIILVIRVPNGGAHGLHAITVSGFKQGGPKAIPPQRQIGWLAESIEKFYAHDDQWGPFARIDFAGDENLFTPWTPNVAGARDHTKVTNVIVSLYPKIRISYEDIEAIVLGIDTVFNVLFTNNAPSDLIWDVKIQFSESWKQQIHGTPLGANEKLQILKKSLPKYIWVASCYMGDVRLFDFTFDATDVNSGMLGENVVCYFPVLKPKLRDFLRINFDFLKRMFNHRTSANYLQFLIDELS